MAYDVPRVLVVGGGAAGVITADTLLRQASADAPVAVTLAERAPVVGPGLAYGTTDPRHLLNNYALRMSAREDDPEHLLRWCRTRGVAAEEGSFLTRSAYGRYLAELLDAEPVPDGSTLERVHDEVVELTDADGTYLATTASGSVLTADVVVLALGNPPPRVPRGLEVPADRLVVDPWDPGLVDRVGPHDRVLLVGTGLTTVDLVASLGDARPGARITAASRHGLLPRRHLPELPHPSPGFDGDVRSLREVLAEVRAGRAAGADWRSLVESLKLLGNDAWSAWTPAERSRFDRHVARRWEIARHRMAPPMAAIVDQALASGRLTLARSAEVDPASYDLVVNCTGPGPVSAPGWNPLVDDLVRGGVLRPGPLGRGVDLDRDGALLDTCGVPARGIYAIGAARRGFEWEVAAVPDIRRQVVGLVGRLTARRLPAASPA
jgi:uncharacterized NAD(P)/FAD-binding protein YdhS